MIPLDLWGPALLVLGLLEIWLALGVNHGVGIGSGAIALTLGGFFIWRRLALAGGAVPARYQPLNPHRNGAARRGCGVQMLCNLVVAWVLLLVAVRACSTDGRLPDEAVFPAACPDSTLQGCARVAQTQAWRDMGATPLSVPTTAGALADAAADALEAMPRVSILERTGNVIHARVVSWLWGFADDMWVVARCGAGAEASNAVLEGQSQLRLGVGDMDANIGHLRALLAAVEAEAPRLPEGPCDA